MLTLEIPNTIYEQMVKQARTEAPIEACGILAGKKHKVEQFYPMTNVDQSSDHFMMEPKEQFAVVKDIRRAGFDLLAIYHSHPETPARPSAEDMKLALTPDVVYMIISIRNPEPEVKGFLIGHNTVTEVTVNILQEEISN